MKFAKKIIFTLAMMVIPVAPTLAETVTDLLNRQVNIPDVPHHIMLADARAIEAMSIIFNGDPSSSIAAWDDSLKKKSPDIMTAFASNFPALKKIPTFGNPYTTTFDVENAVARKTDLVIFDIGLVSKLKDEGVMDKLNSLHIPYIFIDFRQKPLQNSAKSIELLGEVFHQQENTTRYLDFYRQRMSLIEKRVATLSPQQRPTVFIERSAGILGDFCCSTFGQGSMGEFVQAAGGINLGGKLFDGMGGDVTLEKIITLNPDFYLLTGADWQGNRKASASIPLGYGLPSGAAKEKLAALMNRTGFNVLQATQNHHVLAIYHQFYDLPSNVVAVEAIAKFLHPQLFKDIDPQADLENIHQNYMGLKTSGTFWVSQ
ncbi:periplasmic binding protein [Tatumella ptyseos ATCC 33301]|uniref:Periplasmic binding protein n=2 Tax=Tatumella ptyseos TaxID=82987 RepID=A0A085JPH3_9GAMM|nr:ABC transporter substrate-binding protein [Tatumella ptyseos]KFD22369.1 periplasmic binding protein [Tatumella ptyseos ATCC 33301]SQK77465.1 ferrichrome/ferrioxamine B periplasmic transporter [Tatumella ptyseos]